MHSAMALHTVTIFVLGTFRSVAYKCCSTSSILFFSRSIQWAAAPPRPCPWPCRSGRVALQGPARGWLACRAMAWPESWIQGPGLCGGAAPPRGGSLAVAPPGGSWREGSREEATLEKRKGKREGAQRPEFADGVRIGKDADGAGRYGELDALASGMPSLLLDAYFF